MTIQEVYERFLVPPNLAEHMLTVAQVVRAIEKHWIGETIAWDVAVRAALLHDVGNIVKFSFSEEHKKFLGAEAERIEYWREVQKKIIEKYGADDHMASGNMLKEIGLSEYIHDIIQNKSVPNAIEVARGDDWYAKILLYADMRVMPHGIVSLEERLTDVHDRMPKYSKRPDFEEILEAIRSIEKSISERVDVVFNDIVWDSPSKMDKSHMLATTV